MNLQKVSNNDLWKEWKDSLKSAASDSGNGYAKRREVDCMNEIIRRMQEASRRPLQRQEVQA